MTPLAKPFGWRAYHFHVSDLHLIVTLTMLFGQAKLAGAMIGDGISERFAAAPTSAVHAAGLSPEAVVPVVCEATPESVRKRSLAVLNEAVQRGYAGLWLLLLPPAALSGDASADEVDLAWTHLTEHYPISILCTIPFDDRRALAATSLRRGGAYYYSAGQLIR